MNEVILHIGLHKTATGTLQRQFFPACSDLELLTTSDGEVRAFVQMVTRTDPAYFSCARARELIGLRLSASKPNLLSNESLSGPPYAGAIEAGLDHRSPILSNLKSVFPDARTIIVLRRQDALAKSFYRQYLKSGGTRPIGRFYGLDAAERAPLMPFDRFLFSPYIAAVYESFPAGVLVLPFEMFVQDADQFLRTLTEFIGVDYPTVKLKRENASVVGPLGMEVLRVLNYIFRSHLNPAGLVPGFRTSRYGITRRISPVQYLHDRWPGKKGGAKNIVTESIAKRILDKARTDNQSLDAEYGLGLKAYGYY